MIHTLHLFPEIDQKLLEVLGSLSEDDWSRPTIVPRWNIKEVASHLLDGTLRGLSLSRDAYFGEQAENIDSYQDLLGFLNRLNADWVKATRRLSPTLLIQLLGFANPLYTAHLKELDLQAASIFSVAWAGEKTSRVWFHIAREYTEKFHHQQQIRLAVNQDTPLLAEKFYLPYLDTSMQGLPHHYRKVEAQVGTTLKFSVTDITKTWFLHKHNTGWALVDQARDWDSEVDIEGKIAWRMFTKGISKKEAQARLIVAGNTELGEKILEMLAVMA